MQQAWCLSSESIVNRSDGISGNSYICANSKCDAPLKWVRTGYFRLNQGFHHTYGCENRAAYEDAHELVMRKGGDLALEGESVILRIRRADNGDYYCDNGHTNISNSDLPTGSSIFPLVMEASDKLPPLLSNITDLINACIKRDDQTGKIHFERLKKIKILHEGKYHPWEDFYFNEHEFKRLYDGLRIKNKSGKVVCVSFLTKYSNKTKNGSFYLKAPNKNAEGVPLFLFHENDSVHEAFSNLDEKYSDLGFVIPPQYRVIAIGKATKSKSGIKINVFDERYIAIFHQKRFRYKDSSLSNPY